MNVLRAKRVEEKEVMVSMEGSPSHYCSLVCRILTDASSSGHEPLRVKLGALEGAIVIAVDAANRAVREGMAVIEGTHTSSVPVTSKTTGRVNQRSKLVITLRAPDE